MKNLFLSLLLLSVLNGSSSHTGSMYNSHLTPQLKEMSNQGSFNPWPQTFIENKGQVRDANGAPAMNVKFVFNRKDLSVFLLNAGIAYQFTRIHSTTRYMEQYGKKRSSTNLEQSAGIQQQQRCETFRMDMNLLGANPECVITTEGRSSDYTNYFNHDVSNVHHYSRITYHGVYPGIDWVIYTNGEDLKYDFVVSPGADPSLIRLQFRYQEGLKLNADGSFTLKNRLGSITEKSPVSRQGDREIGTAFKLNGDVIFFETDAYDPSQTLVIDPSIVWSTYYGGAGTDMSNACSVDISGNVYMAGQTGSPTNIAAGGHQNTYSSLYDAFLVKFNAAGQRQWGTYYGGSGQDQGEACAIDGAGNVYLVGHTSTSAGMASSGHQNTFGGQTDAFLVKFNSNGQRLWATYYGGTGVDYGYGCHVDPTGNVYMTGSTKSTGSIASGGHQNVFGGITDAFLVKFTGSGIRLWATYYGGSSDDVALSCSGDSQGNVYMAGKTLSTSDIASGGHQNNPGGASDAFLVKFNAGGTRQWASYYGGSGSDAGQSCAVDPNGNIYLAGNTNSTNDIASVGFKVALSGGLDAFLVKFDAGGARQWGTYYGGLSNEDGICATDMSSNVYLSGYTESSANIAYNGYRNSYGGSTDAYLVKFSPTGQRFWATYFGGSDNDKANACAASGDYIYLSGETRSTGMSFGGHQNSPGSIQYDGFLAKFCAGPDIEISTGSSFTYVCTGETMALTASGAISYTWGSGSNTNPEIVAPLVKTTYSVTSQIANGCRQTVTITIDVLPLPVINVDNGTRTICIGETATLSAYGANTYTWSTGEEDGTIFVQPVVTETYTVTGTDQFGCVNSSTAELTVDECLDIPALGSVENLILFPNPNSGVFTVKLSPALGSASVQIYNSLGQKLHQSASISGEAEINISAYAKGIYHVLILQHGQVIKQEKIIVE